MDDMDDMDGVDDEIQKPFFWKRFLDIVAGAGAPFFAIC